ncbi:MAG: S1 RNA-binding domain-containing protein [Deltaproteobacteria bacterium]|nr:S1 RNA-binding domain-containing protein [Deltaproteobacteria bacterium]MBW2532165.1 S1 RNA-binding domain-containing protein [Deltaproteobacteria bacterium]
MAEGASESAGDADRTADAAEGKRKGPRPERPAFSVGDQVFGKVCKVTDQAIFVDIAGKATGLLARVEGEEPPSVGDQFIAKVQSSSTRGGMVLLVTEPQKPADARAELREALDKTLPVEGWVTGVIKGGVEVDFSGVRAFAPASHVELRPGADLSHLVGEKLPFLVTHYAKKGRDIVVSRKPMLEASAERLREEQLAKIEPDTLCKGVVRKVLGWGAFVSLPDYGGIEGVVHMREASHDRGAKLGAVMKAGDEIEVKILRVDEKGKLWLSRKGAQKDPWEDVAARYPQWSRHHGKVVRLTDFGAFVQLEPGIDGLCHVSDLSFQPVEHPKDAVSVGEELDVVVANLDPKAHKVGLHPAPPEDEKEERRPRLQAHQKVQVVVMQIREHGLAVRIVGVTGRAQRGFIPAGHSGTPRGTDLRKEFPVGNRFEAKIIEIDHRRGEAKLSIRALKEDAEKQAYREYRKKVQREAHFGTFADLLKKS